MKRKTHLKTLIDLILSLKNPTQDYTFDKVKFHKDLLSLLEKLEGIKLVEVLKIKGKPLYNEIENNNYGEKLIAETLYNSIKLNENIDLVRFVDQKFFVNPHINLFLREYLNEFIKGDQNKIFLELKKEKDDKIINREEFLEILKTLDIEETFIDLYFSKFNRRDKHSVSYLKKCTNFNSDKFFNFNLIHPRLPTT